MEQTTVTKTGKTFAVTEHPALDLKQKVKEGMYLRLFFCLPAKQPDCFSA